jgi:hypothetical protein
MSYRRFTDSEGRTWEAWEVHPAAIERRGEADRRRERRESADRRRAREFRLAIPRELRSGWLALQGSESKLRLAPIPDGWEHLSDEDLATLVARAGERNRDVS